MTRNNQLSPSTARRITIGTSAGPVAALRAGDEGAPAVLLVPGYTGSKEDFAPLCDPLAAAGYQVTAIDLPGQYETPGPDEASHYTPDALGVRLRSVMQELAVPVHVLGHSFGGLVARAAAIAQPGLFTDLVLMSSGPAAIEGARRQRVEQLAPFLTGGLAEVYAAMQLAIAAESGYLAPSQDLADFLRRRFLAGAPAMLQGMGESLCGEPDRVAELAATGLPLLVLTGEHDDAWSPDMQASMAARLGAAHVMIARAAHSPAVENTADTVAALVSFWTR